MPRSLTNPVRMVIFFLVTVAMLSVGPVFSQQKKPVQLEVGFHGSYFLVFSDAGWGYGADAKLLFPMKGNGDYITAGFMLDRLRENNWRSWVPEPFRLINAVGGYRKMLQNFFIEPQLGIGFMIETNKADVPWESDKTRALLNLFPGIEAGIHVSTMTFSFNYRLNFRDPFKDAVYSIFSIKTAYRFGRR